MSERPTPETDALASEHRGAVIWPDFARRLERERDVERAEIIDQYRRERDSERALSDRLAEIVEEGIEDLDEDGGDWPQAFAALAAWKEARSE